MVSHSWPDRMHLQRKTTGVSSLMGVTVQLRARCKEREPASGLDLPGPTLFLSQSNATPDGAAGEEERDVLSILSSERRLTICSELLMQVVNLPHSLD
jgi:hypothetical protein